MSAKAQLFLDQIKGFVQLESQFSGMWKADTIEQNFRDEHRVGNDHVNLAEEGFEIVRERSSTSMERIHGDKQGATLLKTNISVLNSYSRSQLVFSLLN